MDRQFFMYLLVRCRFCPKIGNQWLPQLSLCTALGGILRMKHDNIKILPLYVTWMYCNLGSKISKNGLVLHASVGSKYPLFLLYFLLLNFIFWQALSDDAVRSEFPEATILKPAEFYGHEDRYLNMFACKFYFWISIYFATLSEVVSLKPC